MTRLYLGMEKQLLIAQQHKDVWQVETHLDGLQITCLAVDPFHPERIYCGTYRRGLWRSKDAGNTWEPIGDNQTAMSPQNITGITQSDIMAIAVSSTERASDYGVIYVGTEPSALYRSEDGGDSWQELTTFQQLPSAPTWSFPPKPYTHHVRWITPDPLIAGRVFVAVEAGALVRSQDGGKTWIDREDDGPFDTHTLRMHSMAPNRLYSAAGDGFGRPGRGYSESHDGGRTWTRPDDGFQHHYMWSIAVDPADPDTIIVSAANSPQLAHMTTHSATTIYRKTKDQPWQEVTNGLPATKGTGIAVLTTKLTEAGTFYLLNNRGCYYSNDKGEHWENLNIPWEKHLLHQHAEALVAVS